MFTQANQLHFNLDLNDSDRSSYLLPGQRSVDNLIVIEKVENDSRRKYTAANKQSLTNMSEKLKLASKLAKLDVSNNSFGSFVKPPTKTVRPQPKTKAVTRPVKAAKAYVPVKARKVDRPVQYKKPSQPTYLNSKKVPTAPILTQRTKSFKRKPVENKVSYSSFETAMGGYDKEISLVEDFSKKLRQIIKKEKVMQQKILNRSLNNSFNKNNSFVSHKPSIKPKKPKSPTKSPVTRSPVIKKKVPQKKKIEEAKPLKPNPPKPILQKSSSIKSQDKVKKADSRRAKLFFRFIALHIVYLYKKKTVYFVL